MTTFYETINYSSREKSYIDEIKEKVRHNQYDYTIHAEIERKAEEAILAGEILEQYPDEGRGESCLLIGFSGNIPIHIVCGKRGEKIAVITVYVPKPPKFVDPWTRSREYAR